MKNLLLTVSALALGLCFVSEARADCNGPYLGIRGGASKMEYDGNDYYKSKWKTMVSGALGWRQDYFRIEGEYIWRDRTKENITDKNGYYDKSSLKSYSVMANVYYDIRPYSAFSPYLNAGIGMTKLKYSAYGTSADGSYNNTHNGNYGPRNFTWSVGAGATLKVTSRFNIDAGYRYFDMGAIKKADITDHEIYGGIRYVF